MRIKTKKRNNTLSGRDLVRVRATIEKKPFLVGLWLNMDKIEIIALFVRINPTIEKNTFCDRALVTVRAKI